METGYKYMEGSSSKWLGMFSVVDRHTAESSVRVLSDVQSQSMTRKEKIADRTARVYMSRTLRMQ